MSPSTAQKQLGVHRHRAHHVAQPMSKGPIRRREGEIPPAPTADSASAITLPDSVYSEDATSKSGPNAGVKQRPLMCLDKPVHPVAELFPLLDDHGLRELADDIRMHGLREPIATDEAGAIIDGRNRYLACQIAGVEPRFEVFVGVDVVGFVVSRNLKRRHLTDDQGRVLAVKLANMGQGKPTKTSQSANIRREQAARLVNADLPGVDRARKVLRRGTPEIIAKVERGELSVAAASKIVDGTSANRLEELDRPSREVAKAITAPRRSAAGSGVLPPATINSIRQDGRNVHAYEGTLRCFRELVAPLYRGAEPFVRVRIRSEMNAFFDEMDQNRRTEEDEPRLGENSWVGQT